jgi:AcrR family transcriptional regulator
MTKRSNTKENLLKQACRLFWSRGYSNVPVREIARTAGVDVALISRYYGSKIGLFKATLETLPKINPEAFPTADVLVDMIVGMFANAPKEGVEASPISLILLNADDPEVGHLVMERQSECWQKPFEEIIGSKNRAALFFGAVIGFSVAQKTLHLSGIAEPGSARHGAQLRHILEAALHAPDG